MGVEGDLLKLYTHHPRSTFYKDITIISSFINPDKKKVKRFIRTPVYQWSLNLEGLSVVLLTTILLSLRFKLKIKDVKGGLHSHEIYPKGTRYTVQRIRDREW